MARRSWRPLVALGVASLLGVQTAQALELRPGLWEQTVTTEVVGGAPALSDEMLAKVPPEQRERMKALMGANGARSNTSQNCLTREQLAEQNRDPFAALQEHGMSCKRDLKSNTGNRLEAHVECGGARPLTADTVVEAPNDTTMRGTSQTSRTNDGKQTNIKITFTGKWVSAECPAKTRDR